MDDDAHSGPVPHGDAPVSGDASLDPAWRAAFAQDLLLPNAVAAVKAVLREQPQTALGLLKRGFRRIDAPDTVTGDWPADITRLARTAAAREPGLGPRADRVARLVERHLGRRPPPAAERPGGG
ncbi:hypothetical protein OG413_22445 [Streptomyces sp. NBC_01433]|uniref:hypothetical protein n=1 Tax=Streptomyces sp. NBC_01433 TaxID=2903864 RepID=UPI00224D6DFB|nr:hypothetical protein [Streptomyces sp. NBC_01433]MCX4678039.1 hypothetical protein [Streptomyces sp. NBC_01433]